MIDQVAKSLSDPSFLIALLVGIAVFATAFTALPAFGGNPLKLRMKTVALEREDLMLKGFSAKEREILIGYLHRLMKNVPLANGYDPLSRKNRKNGR